MTKLYIVANQGLYFVSIEDTCDWSGSQITATFPPCLLLCLIGGAAIYLFQLM